MQKSQQLNENKYLSKFIGYSTSSPPQSDNYSLFIIYELPEAGKTLDKYMQKQVIKKDEVEEKLLWQLLENITDALSYLEQKGIVHQDINAKNISLHKGGLLPIFKIFYSSYTISSFDQIIQFDENYTHYNLSPEQLDLMKNQIDEKQYDLPKSDVFSLGMLILQLGTITMNNKIYKINDYQINQDILNKRVLYFKQLYSKQLGQIIEQMLQEEASQRPSFLYIKQNIKDIKSKGFVSPSKARIQQNKKNPKYLKTPDRQIRQSADNSTKSPLKNPSSEKYQPKTNSTRPTNKKVQNFTPQKNVQKQSFNQLEIQDEINQSKVNDISRISRQEAYDKLHYNLREELFQDKEKRKKSQGSRYNTPGRSPAMSQKSSFYGIPQTGSAYRNRQSQSPTKKRFKAPLKSPKSLHRHHTMALEKDLIYQENGDLKEGMERKNYVDGSLYIGQVVNDQRNGIGIYYYQSGEVYAGEWRDNMLSGKGKYVFSNGEMYEGEIKNGKKEGKGIYKYYNGNVYEGNWQTDKKNGQGKYIYEESGEEYIGEFVNGLREGQGQYQFSNGDVFNGNWKKGQKYGQGTVLFANGCKFQGEWSQDQANGNGKLIYNNGDTYEGQFNCGIKEGDGIYLHKTSNSKYEGSWQKDNPQGFGVYYYQSGDVYEGEVLNGKRNGQGDYKYNNGDVYKGQWKNDEKNGEGTLIYKNDTQYTGQWLNNQMSGFGKIIYDNDDTYEGEWIRDKKQGKGLYKWHNGGKYEGNWHKDKMHGYGVYESPEGEITEGYWENNKFQEDL